MTGRPLIGAHVPVGRGLVTQGLAYADDIGAEAVQVFLGNPRGWALTSGVTDEDQRFRRATRTRPTFVHASYLVNLGSPDTATARRSVQLLRHTLDRATTIGAQGVVVHTGSAVQTGRHPAALRQSARHVRRLLDGWSDDRPRLLLEPTAGQGQSLCSTLDELERYLDAAGRPPGLGVCLDTCHVFAAGHDVSSPAQMTATLDHLTSVLGPTPLGLVHANDSLDVCAAAKDRHAPIGAGHIGLAAFRALLRHPLCQSVPVVIETPGDRSSHAEDIAVLKRLRRRR